MNFEPHALLPMVGEGTFPGRFRTDAALRVFTVGTAEPYTVTPGWSVEDGWLMWDLPQPYGGRVVQALAVSHLVDVSQPQP